MEQDSVQHLFRAGSKFEDVVERYRFDSELKTLIFAAIQKIEISVRTRIIHHFSMAHGAFWFLDSSLADDNDLFNANLDFLRAELDRSHDEFITEHFRKYDEPDMPPAWKTLEVASFGTLSKLYKNMNDNVVKKQVARSFNIPQHKCMQSWLAALTIVRNTCAHHARLWNVHLSLVPRMNERMRGKWITSHSYASDRIYPSLCCIAYWLNAIDDKNSFVSDFKSLLTKYPTINPALMGFPPSWSQEPLWKRI
jgi:abortive infection bacteriophage resistance protein